MRGVECGPAPCERSRPSVGEGYLNSQIVLPAAASSAATTSSWLRRTYDSIPAGRYIVYSRPFSTRMDECPSPSPRLHSFFGPPDGQVDARPVAPDMKSRVGPPHCVHCATPPAARGDHEKSSTAAAAARTTRCRGCIVSAYRSPRGIVIEIRRDC